MNEDLIQLLENNNVSFTTQYFSSLNRYRKFCSGGGLANFLDDIRDASSISEMITDIDNYMDDPITASANMMDSIDSDGAYEVYFDGDIANVYGTLRSDNPSLILQTIGLLDFKEILLAWKSFLES